MTEAPSPTLAAMPPVRGRLTPGRPLADLTWLRVGGPAEWLFQPADEADLAAFLAALPAEVPVFPMGVGSNLIVRDGGLPGVTIRLGRGFNGMGIEGGRVVAGSAALDAHVARRAAEAGLDLTFLRTVPGSIGGRGPHERGVLRHLRGRRAGGGRRRPALRRGRDDPRGRPRARLPPIVPARGRRHHPCGPGPAVGRPEGARGPHGGADRPPRRHPAGARAHRRLDLPQPGRIQLHRAGRRRAPTSRPGR